MAENKTQIEIIQIVDGPAERTSKTKGTNYWICKVKDGKTGRIGTAFGAWVKGWKFGDTIEGIWKKQPDYQGQEQWSIENPAQAGGGARRGYAGGNTSPLVSSFMIAATLMAPKFAGTKKNLEELTKLASAIKPLITEAAEAAPAAKEETKAEEKTTKAKPAEDAEETEEEEEAEESLF